MRRIGPHPFKASKHINTRFNFFLNLSAKRGGLAQLECITNSFHHHVEACSIFVEKKHDLKHSFHHALDRAGNCRHLVPCLFEAGRSHHFLFITLLATLYMYRAAHTIKNLHITIMYKTSLYLKNMVVLAPLGD